MARQLRYCRRSANGTELQVGTSVAAKWRDGIFYEATVTSLLPRGNKIKVKYDLDNVEYSLPASDVTTRDISILISDGVKESLQWDIGGRPLLAWNDDDVFIGDYISTTDTQLSACCDVLPVTIGNCQMQVECVEQHKSVIQERQVSQTACSVDNGSTITDEMFVCEDYIHVMQDSSEPKCANDSESTLQVCAIEMIDILQPECDSADYPLHKGSEMMSFHSTDECEESDSQTELSGSEGQTTTDQDDSDIDPHYSEADSSDSDDSFSDADGTESVCKTASASDHHSTGNTTLEGCSISMKSRKCSMENVSVPTLSSGKRSYSKADYCFYCDKLCFGKISSHYRHAHKHQEAVRLTTQETNVKKRSLMLYKLQHLGNYKHNCKVISDGEGELVVVRRPRERVSAAEFLPCRYCFGFFHMSSLPRHCSTCGLKPESSVDTCKATLDGHMLIAPLLSSKCVDPEVETILSGMKATSANERVEQICSQDVLIKMFAKDQVERLETLRPTDINNIRTKLRALGRLTKEVNRSLQSSRQLIDLIVPKNFDTFVAAGKKFRCEASNQLALTLGHHLKSCILMKKASCIMSDNDAGLKDAERFQQLFEAFWKHRVASASSRAQRMNKINKTIELPLSKDIETLARHIKEQARHEKCYEVLAKLLLAGLILFNKRRPAEVASMKVADYEASKLRGEENEEILKSLSIAEQQLAKRMHVVEVRGKSTRQIRKVHVILGPEIRHGIDRLMSIREERGIVSQYLFARPTTDTSYDGTQALKEVTMGCENLKHPERIHSQRLRKYFATMCQVLNMTQSELGWIADHMGHDVNIHNAHYRMQPALIEKTKVAKVLVAMEAGTITRYDSPRNIADINDHELNIADDEEEDDEPLNNCESDASCSNPEFESISNVRLFEKPPSTDVTVPKKSKQTGPKLTSMAEAPETKVTAGSKRRWNDMEKEAFSRIYKKGKMPNKEEMELLASALPNRTTAMIRTRCHNILKGKLQM